MSYKDLENDLMRLTKLLTKKKVKVITAKVLPPATSDEIKNAEAELKLELPSEYKKFLQNECSGMKLLWVLDRTKGLAEDVSPFCHGSCEWSLESISGSPALRDDLADVWSIDDNSSEDEKLWLRSLPFALVGSDYLIIDFKEKGWPVKYYDHMPGGGNHGRCVAENLADLNRRWLEIAGSVAIMRGANWYGETYEPYHNPSAFQKWLGLK